MFQMNKSLIHVDLSHNCFTEEEFQVFSEGLIDNHTILGLHMQGNTMGVDAFGYLTDRDLNPGISHVMTRIRPDLTTGIHSKSILDLKMSSNCWICEGWS